MSMINWATMSVSGAKHMIDDVCCELQARNFPQEIEREEVSEGKDKISFDIERPHEMGTFFSSLEKVSLKYPDKRADTRYFASLPGSYHEIIGACINGKTSVESDTKELVLGEDFED